MEKNVRTNESKKVYFVTEQYTKGDGKTCSAHVFTASADEVDDLLKVAEAKGCPREKVHIFPVDAEL